MSERHSSLPLLAAAGALAALLSACASEKPPVPTATPAPPAAHQEPPSTPRPQPMAEKPLGPVPGSAQDFVVNIGDRVYFALNQYQLSDDGRALIAKQAEWLNRYPRVSVRIEGNADERGTREYNLALGGRRAEAVRQFLIEHGVAPSRITTISYGKEHPIDLGTGEEAWAHNRNAHTAVTDGAN